MIRDRYLIWMLIVVMGLLILAQVVGNGILIHWQSQSEKLSQPNPAAVRMLAK